MEVTQVSINGWTDKQNVTHAYNEILLSLTKEGNCNTCYMDRLWTHYAKWNKSVTKRRILYEVPRVVKFIERESIMVVYQGLGRGGNGKLVFNGYRVSFWEDEKVPEMDGHDGWRRMWMYLML